jgi:hypothetical protein
MDKIQLGTLIAGAVVPFLISLLKRWIKPTSQQISLLVFAVCFLIASGFQLYEVGFKWEEYVSKIVEVYGASQVVYWAVLKSLELDTRIEGR